MGRLPHRHVQEHTPGDGPFPRTFRTLVKTLLSLLNMTDDDVIAYIYPAVGTEGYIGAALTIKMNKKNPGYVPPRRRRPQVLDSLHALESLHRGPSEIFNRLDREPTEDVEEHDALEYEACIKVTFGNIPKTRLGLRAGRSEDAELLLASIPAVGFYHFALTFNDNYCLVVRDLGSTCGTAVVYGQKERGRWISCDWIIGGSDFLKGVSPIIVKVSQFLQFRLIIPQHNVQAKSYRDEVDRFCAGMMNTEHLLDLGHVGLSSRRRTEVPSSMQTPVSDSSTAVTMRTKLGEGTFAVVYRVWNVRTGEQYALKRPKGRSFDTAAWEREVVIMDRIHHVS